MIQFLGAVVGQVASSVLARVFAQPLPGGEEPVPRPSSSIALRHCTACEVETTEDRCWTCGRFTSPGKHPHLVFAPAGSQPMRYLPSTEQPGSYDYLLDEYYVS